ncbi:MAG: hypothetical protein ACKOYC_01940 [Bacteroidota bacterium]
MDFLFISTLFFYLLSIIACLIVFLFNRHVSVLFSKTVIILHAVAGIVLLYSVTSNSAIPAWISIYFWCSGIFLAGDLVRKSFPKALKAYFLAYLITLPVFIVSPSRIIHLVAGKGFGNPAEGRIRIIDNYFLVRTSEPVDSNGFFRSKFIKEMGFFHKTMARDIPVPSKVDSTKLIGKIDSTLNCKLVLFFEMSNDTIHLEQFKVKPKPNTITRKP